MSAERLDECGNVAYRKRDHKSCDKGAQSTCPLVPHIHEHLLSEQREGRSQHVSDKPLSRYSRRRVFAVSVCKIVLDCVEDHIDGEEHRGQGDSGHNPMHFLKLRP